MPTELQSRTQPSPRRTAGDGGLVMREVSRAYVSRDGHVVPAL
ncbi:MAG: hypothetical protein JWM29_226, partial [Solirubrobacterales bacterium]|nr:hypothetical protein [Solirubrobacterales bacterium]